MKAVVCEQLGPPESLVVKDTERPAIKPAHVRVDVHYCSVNFPDALMVQGQHQYKFAPPFIPGGEISGVISELGADVRGLAVGDAVTGLSFTGGFAEDVVVPAERVYPLPPGVDMAQACCLAGTYGTAVHAFEQRAHLKTGESVLVLGAAGGSGAAAVQIAKLMGAYVIAAVGSEEKLAFALKCGADEGFNYATTPLKDAVRASRGATGVDVIYDPVGGDYAEPALRCMAWNGRYLVIGFAAGGIPAFKANLPLLKGCSIVGVFTGEFIQREPEANKANTLKMMACVAQGRLRPVISEVVTLADTGKAMRALLDRKAMGKIVVRVR